MSNHPLNLQLQLVPPQAKDRSASQSSNRRSVDFTNTQDDSTFVQGDPLTRTTSSRSNRSDVTSFYASQSSSMTSISSYASTASGAQGRRMIVPLYNLSAHNVMTNTILDAGTDAKIAKFHKRSLDLLGVVMLEPIEVWPGPARGPERRGYGGEENRLSAIHDLRRTGSRESEGQRGGEGLTPTSSAISLSSAGDSNIHPHPLDAPTTPTTATASEFGMSATPTQSGAKKIFGRIFKKKESSSPVSGHDGSPVRSPRGPTFGLYAPSSPGSRLSFGGRSTKTNDPVKSPSAASASPSTIPPSTTQARRSDTSSGSYQPVLQPAILGIHPTLCAPTNPPVGRPVKYVWVVKKWLKGSDNGLLGGVIKGVGAGVDAIAGVAAGVASATGNGHLRGSSANSRPATSVIEGVEVRFEWVRGTKGSKRKSTHKQRLSTLQSPSQTSVGARELGQHHHQSASAPGTSGSRKSVGVSEYNARTSFTSASGRRSPESRRSVSPGGLTPGPVRRREGTIQERDSRTNSMVSTNASDEQVGGSGEKLSLSPKSASFNIHNATEDGHDNGEESDPEDSETPWSCVLVISTTTTGETDPEMRRQSLLKSHSRVPVAPQNENIGDAIRAQNGSPTSSRSSAAPESLFRFKVATLSPAPHHPKVVAQLKVPFPLPDVDLIHATAIKRVVQPSGALSRSAEADIPDAMILTAEEIKDILSSTGFWLVVREGLGGVGKVNRKGDGWRIRA